MSQSTIYKRNLRRLAKSQKNLDDHRPPIIRVIAGIPFLGDFVPKLNKASSQEYQSSDFYDANMGDDGRKEVVWRSQVHREEFNELPFGLTAIACTTMVASYYWRKSQSLLPLIRGYSQGGWPVHSRMIQTNRIHPRFGSACCALIVTASFVSRSGVRSNLTKLKRAQ